MKCKTYKFRDHRTIKKFLLFKRTVDGQTRWFEFARIRQEFRGREHLGGNIWLDLCWVDEKKFDDRVFKMLKDLAQAKGDKKEIILIRLRFDKDILDNTYWWKFGRRRAAMFRIHKTLDDLVKLPVALGVKE